MKALNLIAIVASLTLLQACHEHVEKYQVIGIDETGTKVEADMDSIRVVDGITSVMLVPYDETYFFDCHGHFGDSVTSMQRTPPAPSMAYATQFTVCAAK